MCTLEIFLTPITIVPISALFTISTIQSILIIVEHYFYFKRTLIIFYAKALFLWQSVMNFGMNCDGITVTELILGFEI